jgi:hypothetical protein
LISDFCLIAEAEGGSRVGPDWTLCHHGGTAQFGREREKREDEEEGEEEEEEEEEEKREEEER